LNFVLVGCRPSQQPEQMPNQINPVELLNGIRDKADVESYGILEYELYDIPGNESSDFEVFVRLYTGILEDGHDGVGGIYVFDHDNHYWLENNTRLSENVKTIMTNHKKNLSTTRFINSDGSEMFVFNFLNSGGIYEYYAVNAHIRGDTNEYSTQEDYDKRIVDYTEAIRLDPENAEAYINRGWAYFWEEDYDKAIADYTEAIRLEPTDAWKYNNRGDAYYEKEDYDKATVDYTEAIRLDPKNAYRKQKLEKAQQAQKAAAKK